MNLLCYLIIYSVAVYGLSNVMVYGGGPFDILVKFRSLMGNIHPTFKDLMSCMMCFPTNLGLILSLINLFLTPYILFTPGMIAFQDASLWYLIIPIDMFYASGVVWILHTLQEMMERVWTNNDDDEISLFNN